MKIGKSNQVDADDLKSYADLLVAKLNHRIDRLEREITKRRWLSRLQPLGTTKECVKCGSASYSYELETCWSKPPNIWNMEMGDPLGEYIKVECGCGHTWQERPLDASEDES